MAKLNKLNSKRLVSLLIFGFFVFCLVGGVVIAEGYLVGVSNFNEATVAVPAPFIAGMYVTGFFGLMFMIKNRHGGLYGWFGLFMVVFSYVGVELFSWLVRGGEL